MFCLPVDYDRYYVQFEVNNPLPNASYSWNLGLDQDIAGIKFSREYDVGEHLVALSRTTGSVAEVIETATIFVVSIPGKTLINGEKQPVSIVDLYTTTGMKQSISLPVKSLELGDAYAQNKSDYVNQVEESWSITTGFLSELQKDRLEATLQQLKGIHPFSFIPRGLEPAVMAVCESWSVTQLSNCTFQISMEMKRYWSKSSPTVIIKNLLFTRVYVTGTAMASTAPPIPMENYIAYWDDYDYSPIDTYSIITPLPLCTLDSGCGADSPDTSGVPFYQVRLQKNGTIATHFGPTGWRNAAYGGIEYFYDDGTSEKG